ncbi:DNA recombination protein RmuC [Pseudorhizobium endolithicum]|uniref:DNA recombination protein RmuC homolog n=1 Tax=Pseudorhizobium endolithicum TaxID=1191678 RepID=A0ABM8PWI5_9HYPH|nr:DNA recombination protein RmuC [Pseudorhizobium endolithicum]CAD7052185.1 DNA recombination protein RmuC [Pseudorhizobium endolithicum]
MDSSTSLFRTLGLHPETFWLLALGTAALAAIAFYLVVSSQRRGAELARQATQSEARLAELMRSQAEMQGRIATMAETLSQRQSELNQAVNQRLDGMSQRLGSTITEQTKSTHENLRLLQERLAVIDAAQNNIQTLAKDVVGLQAILSNKQTRGAFGQGRMEAIIADGLPIGAYEFQGQLSNGKRPDCLVRMPNGAPPLVIDAKFPLEAWNAFRETVAPEGRKAAAAQFRRDLEVHIRDISEKYLINGETQEMAFLFVPSESIFAEIHEHFDAVIQRAQRSRVVIVSPSLLMLSIQVIQAVLKDQRMREQAHLIQGEVALLMEDLARLDDRTRKLQGHFLAAQRDVEQILTSSDKLVRRGARIGALELEQAAEAPRSVGHDKPHAVESRTGLLKLRVVDEE